MADAPVIVLLLLATLMVESAPPDQISLFYGKGDRVFCVSARHLDDDQLLWTMLVDQHNEIIPVQSNMVYGLEIARLMDEKIVVWLDLDEFFAVTEVHEGKWRSLSEHDRTFVIVQEHLGTNASGAEMSAYLSDELERYKIPLRLNTLLFFVMRSGEDKEDSVVKVYEAYSSTLEYTVSQPIVGLACVTKVTTCDPMVGIWERRGDLSRITVRALLQPLAPMAFYNDNNEPTGIFPDVFHDIQRTFNFSYVVSSSVDGTWGRRRPNSSTFSGLVGQLQRKEADIAITIVIISPERAEVVDASFNIMEVGSRLFVRSSQNLELNKFDLLLVFEWDAWCAMGILCCLLIVGFSAIFAHDAFNFYAEDFLDAVAIVTRGLLLKGYNRRICRHSNMSLLLSALIMATLVFAAYRGGLLSKLAVQRPKLEINELEDVLDSDYQFGTLPGGASEAYFEGAPAQSLLAQIWREKMQPNYADVMIKGAMEGLEAVSRRDKYSYSTYDSIGRFSPLYPCQVSGVGRIYNRKTGVFAFQKHSALRAAFDDALLRMRESGRLVKVIDKYTAGHRKDTSECKETKIGVTGSPSARALGVEELFGVFAVPAAMAGVALFLALSEYVTGNVTTTMGSRSGSRDSGRKASQALKVVESMLTTLDEEERQWLLNRLTKGS